MMRHIVWSKKIGKAKLWRSIWLVMKIFRTVSSDVVWPFKNRFCQNRINKIGQIQPKCLRNYAWKIMMWHIVLKIQSVFLMLWKSMCLVMKKNFSLIWRHLTLQKNYVPKSHQQKRPNSAKMLKKWCLKNDDVTYCLKNKICIFNVVEKYVFSHEKNNFSPIWRRLTLQKKYLPKSHQNCIFVKIEE